MLIYSWYKNELPPRIQVLFSEVREHHDVDTRNVNNMNIPKFRLTLRSHCSSISISRTWNHINTALAKHLKLSLNSFSNNCRNYFIKNYSLDCPFTGLNQICYSCSAQHSGKKICTEYRHGTLQASFVILCKYSVSYCTMHYFFSI